MPLVLPEGRRFAVSLGFDMDAQSVWLGTFRSASQSHMSRGEFGAVVATPRLLDFLDGFGITTTWCIPTHTIQTFPAQVEQVVDRGHEIAAHGVWHEYVPKLEFPEERRLIELQLEQHERLLGNRPRGYRSPAIDLTDHTLSLLEEYGFDWDSSLQGRDFEPYRPRLVTGVDREKGNTFGPELSILEFPVSWYLDDFPEFETFNGNAMIQSHDVVLRRWTDTFDYGYERCPSGLMTFTLHPQTIGRAHHMVMLEKFVTHVMQRPGVWFPTLSELFECWVDEEPATSA